MEKTQPVVGADASDAALIHLFRTNRDRGLTLSNITPTSLSLEYATFAVASKASVGVRIVTVIAVPTGSGLSESKRQPPKLMFITREGICAPELTISAAAEKG